VPRGSTTIHANDRLLLLADDESLRSVKRLVRGGGSGTEVAT
jgi:Trk K+ transport system NAD-binding subunit